MTFKSEMFKEEKTKCNLNSHRQGYLTDPNMRFTCLRSPTRFCERCSQTGRDKHGMLRTELRIMGIMEFALVQEMIIHYNN